MLSCKHGQSSQRFDDARTVRKDAGETTFLKQQCWQVVETWECVFHDLFQRDTEAETYVDSLKEIVDPLNPRDAFYGGGVNATKLLVKTESTTTKIKYVDFTSLYPDINTNGMYPVCHPPF